MDTSETNEAAPEAPPLWGEAVFQRAKDGAADFHAHVKVSGDGLRAEGAGFIEKGETLTDPKGGFWAVSEAKHRADGGYSWLVLSPGLAPAGDAPPEQGATADDAEQHELNQIQSEPTPEAPRARRARKQDAEQPVDPSQAGSASGEE